MINAIKNLFSSAATELNPNSSVIERLKKQNQRLDFSPESSEDLDTINHKKLAVLVSQGVSDERHHWPQQRQNRSIANGNGLLGRTAQKQYGEHQAEALAQQALITRLTGVNYNWS